MALKSNPTPLEVVKEVKKLGRGVLTYSETLTGVDENDSALLEISKFSRVPEVGDTFACIFNAGDNGAFYQRREVTQIQSLAVIATVLSSNYIPVGDTGIADNAVTTPKIANGAVTKDKVDSDIKGSLGKADSANEAASEAKTLATSANSAATNAQSTADGAQKAAETAQGAATKAQSTADSALTAANSAQSTADSAAASAKSAGQTANSALGRANVSVRYDIAQGLTADQKAQARSNIGAGTSSFSGDYNNLSNKPAAVLYTAQTLNSTQQSQARTNLGLGSLATKSSIHSSDIANGTIVNADISTNAAISASKISGLATVATSGKYSDLSGKPAEIECYVSPSNDLAYLSIGHSGSIKFQIYGRTEKTVSGTGTRTINFTYSFMYTPIVLLTCSGSGGGTGGDWLQALKVTSVSKTSFSYNKAFKEEGYISWVAFGYDSKL